MFTTATSNRVDFALGLFFAVSLILAGGAGALHYALLGGLGFLAALAPLAVAVLGIYLMVVVVRNK